MERANRGRSTSPTPTHLSRSRSPMLHSPYLELLDWRRRISELFADLRQRPPDSATLTWFRAQKDGLFREHPQSPIPEVDRQSFGGLTSWPLHPAPRVPAHLVPPEVDQPPNQGGSTALHS